MIGAIVGLICGLGLFFFGLALLMQERQDRRKAAESADSAVDTARPQGEDAVPDADVPRDIEADLPLDVSVEPTIDGTQTGGTQGAYTRNFRRIKLGVQLLAQGIILLAVAIICWIVDALWIPLPWYAVVPVVVLFVIIGLVADAYTMGSAILREQQTDADTPDQGDAADAAPQQEDNQETQDCTRNTQDDEDD